MTVVAVVMAAGSGLRLGRGGPKALQPLGDATIVQHALRALGEHPAIDGIVLAYPPLSSEIRLRALVGPDVALVPGGETRQESVWGALCALGDDVTAVLVHDAARPFVPSAVVDRVLGALAAGADAAVPGRPVHDTVKRVAPDGSVIATVPRGELRAVQTPQGFRPDALISAHRYARTAGLRDVSDDAALVERHGGRVVVVEGADELFKITRPWDLRLAEFLLQDQARTDPT